VAFLFPQGVGDGHDPFRETATPFTLGPEAAPSPHDKGPNLIGESTNIPAVGR
jgi:hypothetical protein